MAADRRAAGRVAAVLASFVAAGAAQTDGIVERSDLAYSEEHGETERNCLDLFLPGAAEAKSAPPLVVFVHGGSWTGGDKSKHAFIGRWFAERGFAAAVVNYRLAPFVKWPAFAEDVADACAWLTAHQGEHGYDASRIVLVGHSAGGQIASAIAYDPRWLRAAGVDPSAVRGFVGWSGVYDVRPDLVALRVLFGRDLGARAEASPIVHVRRGAPPSLLYWADDDIPQLDLSGAMFAAQLRRVATPATTHELPHQHHVSYVFRLGTERDVIGDEVAAFVARCTAKDAVGAGPAPAPGTAGPPPAGASADVRREVTIGDAGDARLTLHLPGRRDAETRDRAPLLLVVDAGRRDDRDRATTELIAASWATQGLAVALLACGDPTDTPFPAAAPRVAAAIAWLREHADELGCRARPFLGGSGAGGELAFRTVADGADLAARGIERRDIAGVLTLSSRIDGALLHEKMPRTMLLACERDPREQLAAQARIGTALGQTERAIVLTLPGIGVRDCLDAVGTETDALSALVLGFVMF